MDVYHLDANGALEIHLHHGQWRAITSKKRIVAVVAGTQSGKTSFAPLWLFKEISEKGPGDYVFVAPTYKLLELKALPEFRRLFGQTLRLGDYAGSPVQHFTFSEEGAQRTFGYRPDRPTVVYFGHAQNPDSLESATYKAAVLDEAGQAAFKRGSWEAIQRRLLIHRGRILLCTTPYPDSSWLKTEIIDQADNDPDIDLISFASTMNPAVNREEVERQRTRLPDWKFRMMYLGQITRPSGLIFDCFDSITHVVPDFAIPRSWKRYVGVDFGGVHTCGIYLAEDPQNGSLYIYKEYLDGGKTAKQHAADMLQNEPGVPTAVGGSASEGQWRQEFRAGGLPIRESDQKSVEVGIDRVYAAIAESTLFVFQSVEGLISELNTYARELDENGEPTEDIANKSTYHRLDALRYIISWLRRVGNKMQTSNQGFYATPGSTPHTATPQRTDAEIEALLEAA